jgi:hypothetical protein
VRLLLLIASTLIILPLTTEATSPTPSIDACYLRADATLDGIVGAPDQARVGDYFTASCEVVGPGNDVEDCECDAEPETTCQAELSCAQCGDFDHNGAIGASDLAPAATT